MVLLDWLSGRRHHHLQAANWPLTTAASVAILSRWLQHQHQQQRQQQSKTIRQHAHRGLEGGAQAKRRTSSFRLTGANENRSRDSRQRTRKEGLLGRERTTLHCECSLLVLNVFAFHSRRGFLLLSLSLSLVEVKSLSLSCGIGSPACCACHTQTRGEVTTSQQPLSIWSRYLLTHT